MTKKRWPTTRSCRECQVQNTGDPFLFRLLSATQSCKLIVFVRCMRPLDGQGFIFAQAHFHLNASPETADMLKTQRVFAKKVELEARTRSCSISGTAHNACALDLHTPDP